MNAQIEILKKMNEPSTCVRSFRNTSWLTKGGNAVEQLNNEDFHKLIEKELVTDLRILKNKNTSVITKKGIKFLKENTKKK
jgi:hypothetical protein